MLGSPISDRRKLATSHDGRYSYWQEWDRYVYQFDERTGQSEGWFCSLDAWERTFSKADWIVLVEVPPCS